MKTADEIHVKIPEKLYVGVQGKKPFNTEDPPLAFATPYGDGVKDFAARRSTVDNWAGYNQRTYDYEKKEYIEAKSGEEGFFIDNEFLEGFYFDKAVTRWQTSNKFYRISDPRGFQLEIDTDNLGDILLNSHISKGYIVGKFCWARYNGKAYLVRQDHPSVVQMNQPAVKREKKELKIGDEIYFTNDPVTKYIFCGKFYLGKFGTRDRLRNIESGLVHDTPYNNNNHSYGYFYSNLTQEQRAERQAMALITRATYYEQNVRIRENLYEKDLKPWYVYKRIYNDANKHMKQYYKDYEMRRGPGTFEIVGENKEFKLPEFGKEEFQFSYYGYGGLTNGFLFETKKNLQAFEFTEELLTKVNKKLNPWIPPRDYGYTQHYTETLIEPIYQSMIEINGDVY